MKVVATVPARMGSERLPGKSMRCFGGKPMLWHLISRLRQSQLLDDLIIATPNSLENDIIESFCRSESIPCYRGIEKDVLSRILESLIDRQADVGVIVYGDNPLVDPVVVDEHITLFQDLSANDWVGNDLKTTFPPGMEVEVFDVGVLADSNSRTSDPQIREHGTLCIRQRPDLYSLFNVEAKGVRRRPEINLGVDTIEDAELISVIINHFSNRINYSLEEIIEYLDQNPELTNRNKNIPRRWRKYRSS